VKNLEALTVAGQAVSKRAGRKKDAAGGGGGQKAGFAKKAVFESTKKKEVGVSDLTLLSKISNEAINENLKKRFENREIYVRADPRSRHPPQRIVESAQDCR
jgi:myosin heavy subunit